MAKMSNYAPFVLKWAGGYANKPTDKGGPTMKDVTLTTFTAFCISKGRPEPTIEDLKNISDSDWTEIMKTKFWDVWKADEIKSQAIANMLVGFGWGSGPVTAIKKMQAAWGLPADGIVGPKTITYINTKVKFDDLWKFRKDWFIDICLKDSTQFVNLKGWLNRLYDNVNYCFNLVEK